MSGRFGAQLPVDTALEVLFETYRDLIRKTDALMIESGVVSACSRCAVEKGSCCFAGMDDGYGALLLYVNLLMGSELSEKADFPRSCRFVGKAGCRLKARHSFCLNYFCPDLRESLGEKEVERIQRSVGEQLLAGWELERALALWMANAKTPTPNPAGC